ncbi:TagD Cytidylyltransferase [uncultured Caudovirales phage]|uniref:TagD Cytidylyltransferase n=1 Tax=uncultured Caudovirales phage TaxID=2100421 RepID=A0A6J5LIV5_9CAUD|nr:TagD Cytidylyltransferase [uncultured Caudovirales phage]
MNNRRIIVNGTFDILHRGHIEMLNYARSLGDHLLVCIDSDKRVKELKGKTRPVNKQEDRKFHLDNIKSVNAVWLFDSAEELEHICKLYKPHVMVKGSDYQGKPIVGAEYCDTIVFYDLVNGYSTSKIIENINNRK